MTPNVKIESDTTMVDSTGRGEDFAKPKPEHPGSFEIPAPPKHGARGNEYIIVTKENGRFVGQTNGNLPQLTKAQFNAACRLYRSDDGNYYPSPVAYALIKVPPGEDAVAYKQQAWERRNAELGITGIRTFYKRDENFHDRNGYIKPEDQIIKTENGSNWKVQVRYKEPFQAGSETPHLTIIRGDGTVDFASRAPGDKFAGRSFEEFRDYVSANYGHDAEIKLKSPSGILHDPAFLDAYERGSADKRFRSYADEYITYNTELPLATVNIGGARGANGNDLPDFHVDIGALANYNANASAWLQELRQGKHWDRVHLLTRDGNTYQTPERLSISDNERFKAVMDAAGLPKTMGQQSYGKNIKFEKFDKNVSVLAHTGPGLTDIQALRKEERAEIPITQILVADRNDIGQRTGTYTSLADYQHRQKELPEDAAAVLGHEPDIYSRGFQRPPGAARAIYDSRQHPQTVNSL